MKSLKLLNWKSLSTLRFFKFLLAGGFGAACYIVISSILTFIGVDAWIASVSVYTCLVPIIYLIQKKFVFDSKESHSKTFPIYLTIQLFGIVISALIPFILAKFQINPTIALLCVVMLITVTNYALQLLWAFKK